MTAHEYRADAEKVKPSVSVGWHQQGHLAHNTLHQTHCYEKQWVNWLTQVNVEK